MQEKMENNLRQPEQNEGSVDLEMVKEMVVEAMNREEREGHEIRVNVPVSMIDNVIKNETGGFDIHCDNGHNYTLGSDGYLYDIGMDAVKN